MKKSIFPLRIFCAIIALLAMTVPVVKSIGADATTPDFNDAIQLRGAVRRNLSDLRASYSIILKSREKGLAQRAALYYREFNEAAPDDDKVQAEYVFAHFVALASFPYDVYTPSQEKLRKQLTEYQFAVDQLRSKVTQKLSDSVEVTVMTAMRQSYVGDFADAVESARKAVRQDPKWAFTHYWLGRALADSLVIQTNEDQKRQIASEAIEALHRAETLDPSLSKGNLLFAYIHAYTALGKYAEALQYMDKRLTAISDDVSPSAKRERVNLNTWRADLAAKAREKN